MASGEGNLVAHNGLDGIYVFVSPSRNNEIRGNVVRLNGDDGIDLRAGSNTVASNVVLENVSDGIEVSQASHAVAGVTISANQVFNNGQLGINIVGGSENAAGVTANDTDDPDTGANALQNFPVLVQAVRSNANGLTTVAGSLNSNASTQFRIELFVAAADPSSHGEGQVPWAAQNVTTNSLGDKNFSFQVGGLALGTVLTATATSVTAGNTSEFSVNVTVIAGP